MLKEFRKEFSEELLEEYPGVFNKDSAREISKGVAE